MGYERNDRYGNRGGYGQNRGDVNRGHDRNHHRDDSDDRGFFDRAGDEVRSWFGDEDAERRRRMDEREDERGQGDNRGHYGARGYGQSSGDRDRGQYASRDDQRSYGGGGGYRGGERGYDGRFGGDGGRGGSTWGRDASYGGAGTFGATSGPSWQERGSQDDQHANYRSWRDRQMAEYDRDYADYHRENQSRFETEFGQWRQTRQGQRQRLNEVDEHAEVVGSDGSHIGTVDKVRGDRIILTKNDKDAGGRHHSIPCSWLDTVEDGKVKLSKTADQAKAAWRDEERQNGGGMFGSERNDRNRDDRNSEDRSLNRSFSGTY